MFLRSQSAESNITYEVDSTGTINRFCDIHPHYYHDKKDISFTDKKMIGRINSDGKFNFFIPSGIDFREFIRGSITIER